MSPKIKGYTVDEIAEERRNDLLEEYYFIKQTNEEIRSREDEISRIRENTKKREAEYRIKSVCRVLDYIRSSSAIEKQEINELVVHCMNKLNGNIDGIELRLPKERKEADVGNDD